MLKDFTVSSVAVRDDFMLTLGMRQCSITCRAALESNSVSSSKILEIVVHSILMLFELLIPHLRLISSGI